MDMDRSLADCLFWLSQASGDQEICGFIVDDDESIAIRPVNNVHPEPRHHFAMEYEGQMEIINEYGFEKILAIFHSHPFGQDKPSPEDIAAWRSVPTQNNWGYYIISGHNKIIRCWGGWDSEPFTEVVATRVA